MAAFNVLIAGGGIAAAETALALRELAGERVDITLIAPNDDLVYRPMTVREPFSYAVAERYPLEQIAGDLRLELIQDRFSWVDKEGQIAHTTSGVELPYDALVLCLGAEPRPRFEHALTIDDRDLDGTLHGLIQDVEEGYVRKLAFVMPPRIGWPLPLYELAMLTATRADEMNVGVQTTIFSPERAPVDIFGSGASEGVMALLSAKRISFAGLAYCEVPAAGKIVVSPGGRSASADRIVAMPILYGPHARGLRVSIDGFIPIDAHCQVRGAERVYAAGDATDFPVKHGGLASQQADAAAEAIAALAGVDIKPEPFRPQIHGMMLTGDAPRFLSAWITGGHGFSSTISREPSWSPAAKVTARYLGPYLDELDRSAGRAVGQ